MIRRREFITLLGGAAAWSLLARAQQAARMRRIGVLNAVAADDPQSQRRMTAFVQSLQQLGWTDGRNLLIEMRWGAGDGERLRRYAAELVALAPDVIVAGTTSSMLSLQRATSTVPIVFVQSVRGSPRVCRGRVEMPQGLKCFPSMVSARNGWNCSSSSLHP
jgi:putative ABC transport system substrate-binding protein